MKTIKEMLAEKDAEIKRLKFATKCLRESCQPRKTVTMHGSTLSKLTQQERNDLISQVGSIELLAG